MDVSGVQIELNWRIEPNFGEFFAHKCTFAPRFELAPPSWLDFFEIFINSFKRKKFLK